MSEQPSVEERPFSAEEEADARAWVAGRTGKPASRGFYVAVRLLATLDAERAKRDPSEEAWAALGSALLDGRLQIPYLPKTFLDRAVDAYQAHLRSIGR